MRSRDVTIAKRTTVCIIAFLLLAITLFSAFYISAEAEHDCAGENCPICACILQCEKTLHHIGSSGVLQIAAVLPAILILVSAPLFSFCFSRDTLVSRKVRLDN